MDNETQSKLWSKWHPEFKSKFKDFRTWEKKRAWDMIGFGWSLERIIENLKQGRR